jgi:DNA (cytosine-5)-methyltransferase 1
MGRLDYETETLVAHSKNGGVFDAEPIMLAIRGRNGGHDIECRQDGTSNAILTPNGGRAGMGVGAICAPVCFSAKDHGADAMSDLSPTLRAGGFNKSHANAGVMPAIAYRTTGNDGCYETGDVTACLNTNSDPSQITLVQSWRVRRLTPRECERLQGFPDGYTDVPYRRRNHTPDGPRYKALGNSMATNCMRWIGMRIAMVDALPGEIAA